jgi:Pyruvate/2-oxoacid:ferredoxin oxidoreductase delta subunit
MPRRTAAFVPSPAQRALWPAVSGNALNGLGETVPRRPTPIYWHDPDSTPHGPLQRWFQQHNAGGALLAQARSARQKILDMPLAPLAPEPAVRSAPEWTEAVKRVALEGGADIVGVAVMREDWVFAGRQVPQRFIVMIGVAHDWERMKTAPEEPSFAEVVTQYARGNRAAKALASWLRGLGHDAVPHGGPMAGPVTLIPPAIACGFGELGKHGSIIHRELGASFRLASVLTDVPLIADAPDRFGADDFCLRCRVCEDACPPRAIADAKQTVRGVVRWYVDFDRCLPYFNEHGGCGICIAVCPWSRPGVAPALVEKLARRAGAARGTGGLSGAGSPAAAQPPQGLRR